MLARGYPRAAAEIERADISLHAPALCDLELASALRRGLLQGRVSERRAAEAVASYLALPIRRHGHLRLLGRVLQLRDNFSPYDASYVALAERLSARLLTADHSLARAASDHAHVEVIGI